MPAEPNGMGGRTRINALAAGEEPGIRLSGEGEAKFGTGARHSGKSVREDDTELMLPVGV